MDNSQDEYLDNEQDEYLDNEQDEYLDNEQDEYLDNEQDEYLDNAQDEHIDNEQDEHIDNEQDEHLDNEQDDDPINSKHLDAPLYPGATITFKITMILLLTFAVRHKLSNEAISDLLYIIEILCPKPNLCCKSVYKFKTFFHF